MDRYAALDVARNTLAADCACPPGDLTSGGVTIVEAREVAGQFRFARRSKRFTLLTMGRGVVICCSAGRLGWADANLRQLTADELFTVSTLALIESLVAQDEQTLHGLYLRYLCSSDTFCAVAAPSGITLELFERERIAEAYRFTGFHHALGYQLDHPCPDMIAVAAWHGNQVVGMAGASADSEELWQIGVSVEAAYWGMGAGKALVSRVTEAVLALGKVPYYATRLNNIASGNTARSVGYWLAWTDVYVRDK